MISTWESVKVDGGNMRVYMSLPDGLGRFPGVIVIQHRDGVDEFVKEITGRIASAGYVAIGPDLYHRDEPDCRDDGPTRRSRLRDPTVIKDVNAATDFMKAHRSVDSERVGIIGHCMGGRVVYLMAAVNPTFKVAVMYYGGGIKEPWGEVPSPFERTAEIHCPILGHFGEEDINPSPEDVQGLDAELTKWGKVHDFHSYPNAGHGFMYRGSKNYRSHAAEASWPKTLEFLGRYLGQSMAKGTAASS